MEIKTRFKPGDIVWVDSNIGPRKFLIAQVIVDENEVAYSNGRGGLIPEAAARATKAKLDITDK
jgi:hypothetical protein